MPDNLHGEGERVELLKLFARSDIGLISIPPSCKMVCQRKSKTGDNNTCSLNLSERLRLASIKPDGESESDSRRCGTFARLFLRATRASTDLTNESIERVVFELNGNKVNEIALCT